MDESGDFIIQDRAEQQLKCTKTGLVSSHGNGDAIRNCLNSPSHRTGSSTYRVSPSGSDTLKSPFQPTSLNSGICSQKFVKRPEALRVASIRQELRSDLQFQEQSRTDSIFKNCAAFDWPRQFYKTGNLLNAQSASAISRIRSSVDHLNSSANQNDQYPAKKEESVLGYIKCRGTRNQERVPINLSTTKQSDKFPRLDILAEPSMYLQHEQPQQLNNSCRNSLPLSLSASSEISHARLKKEVAYKRPSEFPNILDTLIQHAPNIAEHHRLNSEVKDNFQVKFPTIQGATTRNVEKTLDLQEGTENQSHLQGSRKKRRNPPKASGKAVSLKKRFEESDECASTGYPTGCSSTSSSSIQDDDSSS